MNSKCYQSCSYKITSSGNSRATFQINDFSDSVYEFFTNGAIHALLQISLCLGVFLCGLKIDEANKLF